MICTLLALETACCTMKVILLSPLLLPQLLDISSQFIQAALLLQEAGVQLLEAPQLLLLLLERALVRVVVLEGGLGVIQPADDRL